MFKFQKGIEEALVARIKILSNLLVIRLMIMEKLWLQKKKIYQNI